jgi:hypothetical protein
MQIESERLRNSGECVLHTYFAEPLFPAVAL